MRKLLGNTFAALFFLSSCQLNPTNPFDPDTPPDFQQRGRITGLVQAVKAPIDVGNGETVLPAAGLCEPGVPGDHAGFVVVLRPLVDDPELGTGIATEQTRANGRFEFLDVPPGRYSLEVLRDGFEVPPPRELTVGVGQTVDVTLCGVNLTPPDAPVLDALPALVDADDAVSARILFPVLGTRYAIAESPSGAAPLPVRFVEADADDVAAGVLEEPLLLEDGDATPKRQAWRVDVTAVDALGNESAPATAVITRDEVAPAAPVDVRAAPALDRVALTWAAGDAAAGDDGAVRFVVSYGLVPRPETGDPACPFGVPSDDVFDGASFAVEGPSPVEVAGTALTLSGILPGTDLFLYVAASDEVGNAGCFSAPVLARPDVVTFGGAVSTPLDLLQGTRAVAEIDGVRAFARGDAGLTIVDRNGIPHVETGVASDVVAFGGRFLVARGALGFSLVPVDADGIPAAAGAPGRIDRTVGDVVAAAARPGRALLAVDGGLAAVDPASSAAPAIVPLNGGPLGNGVVEELLTHDRSVVVVFGDAVSVRRRADLGEAGSLGGLPAILDAEILDGELWLALGSAGVRRLSLACPGASCLATLAARALPGGASAVDLLPHDDVMLVAAHDDDGDDSVFALGADLRAAGRAVIEEGARLEALVPAAGGFCACVRAADGADIGDGLQCFSGAQLPIVDRQVRFDVDGVVLRVRPDGARGWLLERPDGAAAAAITQARLADGELLSRAALPATPVAVALIPGVGALVLDETGVLHLARPSGDLVEVAELDAALRAAVPLSPGALTGFLESDGQEVVLGVTGPVSLGSARPAGLFRLPLVEDGDALSVDAGAFEALALPDVVQLANVVAHRGRYFLPTQPFGLLVVDAGALTLLSGETLSPAGSLAESVAADVAFLDPAAPSTGAEQTVLVGTRDLAGSLVEGLFDAAGNQLAGAPAPDVLAASTFGRFLVVTAQDTGAVLVSTDALAPVLRVPDVADAALAAPTRRGLLVADAQSGAAWLTLR